MNKILITIFTVNIFGKNYEITQGGQNKKELVFFFYRDINQITYYVNNF